MEKQIIIPKELNDALQQRQIELDGIQRLLAFAWSTTEYQIPEDRINKLQAEYNRINNEYSILKDQVTDIVTVGIDRERASWNLNFDTNTVTLYVKD